MEGIWPGHLISCIKNKTCNFHFFFLVSTRILSISCNTDNTIKCFLTKFLKDRVTLKTGVMTDEYSALPSQEYIIFENILTQIKVTLSCNNISQYYGFIYILIK